LGDNVTIISNKKTVKRFFLVGGFNPFEKYESKWIYFPLRGENKKTFETTI